MTSGEAAAKFNVSERSVTSARKVLDQGVPELVAKVERDEVKVSTAAEIAMTPTPSVSRDTAQQARHGPRPEPTSRSLGHP